MPNYHGYETTTTHYAAMWNPTYFDDNGKSTVNTDPAFKESFEWQKQLVDKLGGYDKLEKYRTTFGDEFGAKNPFQTGQVAMALDGEWRAGFVDDANVDFDYAVAPFPVPDDQADTYGKGYLSGTIIGIASTSEKQNAAWEFVKYLTTDTEAVVSFANAIHNIPSTLAALKSPDLDQSRGDHDVHRDRAEPGQQHDPGQPQRRCLPADPAGPRVRLRVRQGERPSKGLDDAADQINTDIEQAE